MLVWRYAVSWPCHSAESGTSVLFLSVLCLPSSLGWSFRSWECRNSSFLVRWCPSDAGSHQLSPIILALGVCSPRVGSSGHRQRKSELLFPLSAWFMTAIFRWWCLPFSATFRILPEVCFDCCEVWPWSHPLEIGKPSSWTTILKQESPSMSWSLLAISRYSQSFSSAPWSMTLVLANFDSSQVIGLSDLLCYHWISVCFCSSNLWCSWMSLFFPVWRGEAVHESSRCFQWCDCWRQSYCWDGRQLKDNRWGCYCLPFSCFETICWMDLEGDWVDLSPALS